MSNLVNPKFSLIFLTWNRKDVIKNILIGLAGQTCTDFETIVVDNASTDATSSMLEQEFKTVKLIKLERNLGVAGYNFGINQAKGDIIILLDSDAALEDNALLKLKHRFEKDSNLHAVSLNIINHNNNESETKGWLYNTPNINGCAVAIKRDVLEKVGGYDTSYFLYHNDLELATRILSRGYRINYDTDIICNHLRAKESRVNSASLFYLTRNALFYYWKYYPLHYASILSLREAVYGFSRSLKENAVSNYLKGLLKGIISIPLMLNQRVILNKEIYLSLKSYLDGNFREPLIKKIISKI